jgi:hypothetical protein
MRRRGGAHGALVCAARKAPATASITEIVVESETIHHITSTEEVVGTHEEEEIQQVGCISHHEAMELLALRSKLKGGVGRFLQQGGVSLDLGKSETSVVVCQEGISLPMRGGLRHAVLVATWQELEDIVTLSRSGQVGARGSPNEQESA